MKLSARNVLKGKVVEVKKGAVAAQVRVDIGGHVLTSMITVDAVEDLGLKQAQRGVGGDQVHRGDAGDLSLEGAIRLTVR